MKKYFKFLLYLIVGGKTLDRKVSLAPVRSFLAKDVAITGIQSSLTIQYNNFKKIKAQWKE